MQDTPMQLAHKIRLNPTPEQEIYFKKACGTARFVYNWARMHWKPGVKISDLKSTFNAIKGEQFPWIYEVTKCAAEQAFKNFSKPLENYFKSNHGKRKGKHLEYTKSKSRRK